MNGWRALKTDLKRGRASLAEILTDPIARNQDLAGILSLAHHATNRDASPDRCVDAALDLCNRAELDPARLLGSLTHRESENLLRAASRVVSPLRTPTHSGEQPRRRSPAAG